MNKENRKSNILQGDEVLSRYRKRERLDVGKLCVTAVTVGLVVHNRGCWPAWSWVCGRHYDIVPPSVGCARSTVRVFKMLVSGDK